MERLFTLGLANAAASTVLALGVAMLARFLRQRPGWLHCLWLLVLLKLVTPPLFEVPLPRMPDSPRPRVPREAERVDAEPEVVAIVAAEPADAAATSAAAAELLAIETPTQSVAISPQRTIQVVWVTGSALVLALAGIRIARFRRLLRLAEPVPEEVQDQVAALAARLGLARAPSAWQIDAPLPPLLWAMSSRPRLILPTGLWKRLDARQRRLLLAHELAHLKRGDHLVRLFELVVTVCFWWLPTVWWTRKALRCAEEDCCDAWVVWAFPKETREYAETLLDTVEFLSDSRPAVPLLASGFGGAHHLQLQRRLTMIMQGTTPRRLGLTGALGAFGLSACLLPLTPGWAQTPGEKSTSQSISIQVKTDDEAKPGKEAKAEVRVGVAVDGELQEVKADSVAQAVEVLKQRVEALAREDDGAKKNEARIKALKEAILGLEKAKAGTLIIHKMDGPDQHATVKKESRSVVVLRSNPDPKDQAKIEKAKARIASIQKDLAHKQKELAEAQRELDKLAGPHFVVGEVAPEIEVIGKPLNEEQIRVLRMRVAPGPGDKVGSLIEDHLKKRKDQERIEALEKKLSKLAEELDGLRKQREDKSAGRK